MTPEQKLAFSQRMKDAKNKKKVPNLASELAGQTLAKLAGNKPAPQMVVKLTPSESSMSTTTSRIPAAPAIHIKQESHLSIEQLKRLVPAAFADGPSSSVSAKYQFINTAEIITRLMKEGFSAVRATQNRARTEDDKLTTRHMIRFRQSKIKPIVGDVFPEVIVVNGHNGGVTFEMKGGLYRLACSNGLVTNVADRMNTSAKHIGDDMGAIIEGAYRVIKDMATIDETVKAMQGHMLVEKKAIEFAKNASVLAYGEGHILAEEPKLLLSTRRTEDEGMDLWHVFNRVQENIMRGGMEYQSASGRTVTTKGITRVKREMEFNSDLWSLAEGIVGKDYILG